MTFILYTILGIFLVIFIAIWIYALIQWKNLKSNINIKWPHIYSNLSNLFTSIGVLGTFTGITVGLLFFDEENITDSIPLLLRGLKTAFITSIIGISSSIVAGRISAHFEIIQNKKSGTKSNDELAALNEINKHILQTSKEINLNLNGIKNAISSTSEKSLYMELAKINSNSKEQLEDHFKQTLILQDIKKGITNKSSNLIQEINGLRDDNAEARKNRDKNNKELISKIEAHQKEISNKISMNTTQVNKNETLLKSITEEIQ